MPMRETTRLRAYMKNLETLMPMNTQVSTSEADGTVPVCRAPEWCGTEDVPAPQPRLQAVWWNALPDKRGFCSKECRDNSQPAPIPAKAPLSKRMRKNQYSAWMVKFVEEVAALEAELAEAKRVAERRMEPCNVTARSKRCRVATTTWPLPSAPSTPAQGTDSGAGGEGPCVHCKEVRPLSEVDHWERCPPHPARRRVEWLQAQLVAMGQMVDRMNEDANHWHEATRVQADAIKAAIDKERERCLAWWAARTGAGEFERGIRSGAPAPGTASKDCGA